MMLSTTYKKNREIKGMWPAKQHIEEKKSGFKVEFCRPQQKDQEIKKIKEGVVSLLQQRYKSQDDQGSMLTASKKEEDIKEDKRRFCHPPPKKIIKVKIEKERMLPASSKKDHENQDKKERMLTASKNMRQQRG